MILALKMKTEIFDSFLDTRQPIWNWEILVYDWVELSDKIIHLLFKNGVTANIQWRERNIVSTLHMVKCKRRSIADLSRHVPIYRNGNFRKNFRKNETAVPQITLPKTENATTNI